MRSLVRINICLWMFLSSIHGGTLPTKCCFPKQYESFMYSITGLQDGDTYEYGNGTLRTAFDGINQISFTHEHSSMPNVLPVPIPVDSISIVDYKANVQWHLYNDQRCFKMDVGSPIYEECIPGNATLISQGTFGKGGKIMKTYFFHDTIYGSPKEITISVIMSDKTGGECWPVRMSFSSAYVFDSNKNVDLRTVDIFDFSPGIKDRSIFTPPSVCDQAKNVTQSQRPGVMWHPVGLKETLYAFSARMKQNQHGG